MHTATTLSVYLETSKLLSKENSLKEAEKLLR
jgi:hypothetical protein